MAYNEAKKNAAIKYMRANTDDIRLRVPKGTKDKWRKYAESQGVSLTSFVLSKINEIVDN